MFVYKSNVMRKSRVLKVRKENIRNEYFENSMWPVFARNTAAYITSNSYYHCVYATSDPRIIIPRSSKTGHQSARNNSANSNVASVGLPHRQLSMATLQRLAATKNRKAVMGGGKVSSLFDFCSYFSGFAVSWQVQCTDCNRQWNNYVVVLIEWGAWYWFVISCHPWSVTSMAVVKKPRQNNQYTR